MEWDRHEGHAVYNESVFFSLNMNIIIEYNSRTCDVRFIHHIVQPGIKKSIIIGAHCDKLYMYQTTQTTPYNYSLVQYNMQTNEQSYVQLPDNVSSTYLLEGQYRIICTQHRFVIINVDYDAFTAKIAYVFDDATSTWHDESM